MKEKIAFPHLVGLVAEKASTTERMSELFLQELFAVVTQELAEGKSVTIKGLGTFKTVKDDSIKDVVFSPDKELSEAVNAPFSQFEAVELCDEVTDEMLNEVDASMESAPKEQEPQETPAQNDNAEQIEEEQAQDVVTEDAPIAVQEENAQKEDTPQALSIPVQEEDTQETKPESYRKWLIAAAVAFALIAAWYFYTHRSKDHSDKATETTQVAKNDTTTNAEATKPQPVVTDTIGNGNVLFTMAKKHYGDQAFWVYIARENQAQYPDYRKIKSGAILVIPPAEKYGINSDSKQSLKQANAEAMKLYKEVKAADVNNVSTNEESKDEEKAKPQTTKSVKKPVKKHSSKYTHYKKRQKRRYHR
ncbi:MAG: HU family DNA-binding protein [Muribaculaceae bacterium]|nr:HU family DNA-binding protein [Muribaculaceae bacterium]